MTPRFAVVGHPNKGKSSIVATLARDDTVAIAARSGTTTVAETLTVRAITAEFELIDTPGFQRPRGVLAWLKEQAGSADQRADAVARFVADPDCAARFPDEVRLLQPIVDGAAILYVVDGSRPFGQDYEAEMEVLRWTGEASMALINPIENERHVAEWERALTQYFRIVRVFNAMEADFDRQLAVLEAFALLREDWATTLRAFVTEARTRRVNQLTEASSLLASLLTELCLYELVESTTTEAAATALQASLESRFYDELRAREGARFDELKQLFGYRVLQSRIEALPIEGDLFDTERWVAWGLNRKQLTVAAAMGGAAAGALVDLGLAGLTFGIGTVTGGLLAAGGTWLNADRVADFQLSGSVMGGFEARQGPVRNPNFPYVLVGRFLTLLRLLNRRTHAARDVLAVPVADIAELMERVDPEARKSLHAAMLRLSKQRDVPGLATILFPLVQAAVD